tara:strand:+ start:1975 stop:3042 length:1068 start_codon:yes stop_codon:yes gene_type:complete
MKIALYTTCYNQYFYLERILQKIPEQVDVYVLDLASTDDSYSKLKANPRVNAHIAEFDPFSMASALNFIKEQIVDADYCIYVHPEEDISASFFDVISQTLDGADALRFNVCVFDEYRAPEYIYREIRLHRNTKDWVWHYPYLPKLSSRKASVKIDVCLNPVIEARGSDILPTDLDAAKFSWNMYQDSYSGYNLACLLLDQGTTAAAAELFLVVAEFNDEYAAKSLLSLSQINAENGVPDLKFLLEYHAQMFKCPTSHLEVARAYYKLGWYESALGAVHSGLKVASAYKTDNLEAETGYIWKLCDIASFCYWSLGDNSNFKKFLKAALNANPNNPRLRNNYAKSVEGNNNVSKNSN